MITAIRFRADDETVILQVFEVGSNNAIVQWHHQNQEAPGTWRDAKVEDLLEASRVIHTSGLNQR